MRNKFMIKSINKSYTDNINEIIELNSIIELIKDLLDLIMIHYRKECIHIITNTLPEILNYYNERIIND